MNNEEKELLKKVKKLYKAYKALYNDSVYAKKFLFVENFLIFLNNLLGYYGVLSLHSNDNQFHYEYLNVGDTYTETIFYDVKKDKFFISSLGDIIEKKKNKFYTIV